MRDIPIWKEPTVKDAMGKLPMRRQDVLGWRKESGKNGKPIARTWKVVATQRGMNAVLAQRGTRTTDMATVCPLKNVGELTGICRKKIGRALSYVCFKEVQEWQEEELDEDTFVNWANRDRIKEKMTINMAMP